MHEPGSPPELTRVDAAPSRGPRLPTELTPLRPEPKPDRGSCLATVRLAVASSAGLFADGYDLQTMNLTLAIMQLLYPRKMGPGAMSFAAAMMLAGVVVGQVLFGTVADVLGRKWVSITTASLTILGAGLSSIVTDSESIGIAIQLGICRFFLGLGIGGEYPLSAAVSQETTSRNLCCTPAQMLVYNITMFNFGALLQAFLVLCMISLEVPLGAVWRLALAVGALPSLMAGCLRIMMHEPETWSVETPIEASPHNYIANFRTHVWSRGSIVLGACLAWALFNATSYGHGAFFSIVAERVLGATEGEAAELTVQRDAVFALMTRGAAVASCLVGFCLESHLSRRTLQLLGFSCMALPLWLVGVLFARVPDSWNWLIVVLYMVVVFMMSFVGISTYLVPSEYVPASVRGTCVGIAAASGKAGAILGTALFPLCEASYGLGAVMVASGFLSFLGVVVTACLTPSANPEDSSAAKDI